VEALRQAARPAPAADVPVILAHPRRGWVGVLHYIATVVGELNFEHFRETLCEQLPELNEGLEQGIQRGQAELLTKQAQLKFGELAPAVLARIGAASIEELDRYSERILAAETLDELLAD